MSERLIKICGLRTPEAANVAVQAGASLLGLIFAESKRQLSPDDARLIVGALQRDVPHPPRTVGVFVNETAEVLNELAESVSLDILQLSGDEDPAMIGELARPVIKVLRLPAGTDLASACREAERFMGLPTPPIALMLDTHAHGSYGGTGQIGDWSLTASLAERYPVILAGGLTPGNVAEAIAQVGPLGVDSSSGVETEGVKDADKIRGFIAAARAQFSATMTLTGAS